MRSWAVVLCLEALALLIAGATFTSAQHGEIRPRQESTSFATGSPQPNKPTSIALTSSVTSPTTERTASASAHTESSSVLPQSAEKSASSSAATTSTTSKVAHTSVSLPLKPEITAPIAVAGTLLIVLGSFYALIGIKLQWVLVPVGVSFLINIAVAVLIVYVSKPPLGNGTQGAYFAAIFGAGIVLGFISWFFRQITESLVCLLGGYCFSMWLLVLRNGSLIHVSGSRAIFIVLFSLAAYSLWFSRYTQTHGLIGCSAIAGSTALALGIDCFSRAGLKEFWLYIWNLNSRVFPLGTDDYPMTKGLRVEIAVIFLGAIAGALSQMRLWQLLRQRGEEDSPLVEHGQRRLFGKPFGQEKRKHKPKRYASWRMLLGSKRNRRSARFPLDTGEDMEYNRRSYLLDEQTRTSIAEELEMRFFNGFNLPPLGDFFRASRRPDNANRHMESEDVEATASPQPRSNSFRVGSAIGPAHNVGMAHGAAQAIGKDPAIQVRDMNDTSPTSPASPTLPTPAALQKRDTDHVTESTERTSLEHGVTSKIKRKPLPRNSSLYSTSTMSLPSPSITNFPNNSTIDVGETMIPAELETPLQRPFLGQHTSSDRSDRPLLSALGSSNSGSSVPLTVPSMTDTPQSSTDQISRSSPAESPPAIVTPQKGERLRLATSSPLANEYVTHIPRDSAEPSNGKQADRWTDRASPLVEVQQIDSPEEMSPRSSQDGWTYEQERQYAVYQNLYNSYNYSRQYQPQYQPRPMPYSSRSSLAPYSFDLTRTSIDEQEEIDYENFQRAQQQHLAQTNKDPKLKSTRTKRHTISPLEDPALSASAKLKHLRESPIPSPRPSLDGYTSKPRSSKAPSDTQSLRSVSQDSTWALSSEEGDEIPLSQRRAIIHHVSQQSHTETPPVPRIPDPIPSGPLITRENPRNRSASDPTYRASQLASWRASVAHDAAMSRYPDDGQDERRVALLMDKQQERLHQLEKQREDLERQKVFDRDMRKPEMQDAHRAAMRKMQQKANRAL